MEKNLSNSILVDRGTAARHLGIEKSTLSVWASTKRYNLPYVKIGRLVRYKICDLDAFIASRVVGGERA